MDPNGLLDTLSEPEENLTKKNKRMNYVIFRKKKNTINAIKFTTIIRAYKFF